MSARDPGRWILAATGVVIAGAVAGAVAVMGTPGAQRDVRLDERRVSDLQDIDTAVQRYHDRHGMLPADLTAITARPGVALQLADPVTGERYGFRATGARSYRLCARFASDTAKRVDDEVRRAADDAWSHGVGETCFDRRLEAESKGDVAEALGR